jgi:uncharacterized spore protein YtfJ
MSDQNEPKPVDAAIAAIADDKAINLIQDTMEHFLSAANVGAVYSDPIEHGESLVIPAAEVVSAFGFGAGSGYGGEEDEDGGGGGSGGGGGGRVFSRPVAVIVAEPGGVRVDPVFDITKIALAGLTASAFMIGMLARMLNPKKTLDDLKKGKFG